MRNIVIIFATALCVMMGCGKDEEYNSQLVISPVEQLADGEEFAPLSGVKAYVFEVFEEGTFSVETYADALEGRALVDGSVVTSTNVSQAMAQEWNAESIAVQLTAQFVYLLVVDTKNEDYAYSQYEVGVNLPDTYMTVPFRPWKIGIYEQGDWVYVAEN